MITQKEVQDAITQCLNEKNPNANTCMKLAAFMIINERFNGGKQEDYSGDSEFASIVKDKSQSAVYGVFSDLLDKLQLTNPRLYDYAIKRLKETAFQ